MMGDSGDEEDRAFLDDEDDTGPKAPKTAKGTKRFVAPLVPSVKGVCWEVGGVQPDEVLNGMRAESLLVDERGEMVRGGIDPFCVTYWGGEMPPPPPVAKDAQMMLKKVGESGMLEVSKAGVKTKTPFPEGMLADFLKAIHGTTHNQTLLVELLKKQYTPPPKPQQLTPPCYCCYCCCDGC